MKIGSEARALETYGQLDSTRGIRDNPSPQQHLLRMVQPLVAVALLGTVLLFGGRALGSVTASISGAVRDISGGVIVGATVTVTNTDTGIAQTQRTNAQGYYTFPALALGHYDIEVRQTGFEVFRQTGLVLNVNSALTVDVTLSVGQVTQSVTVSSRVLQVERSNTQMGEVIGGQKIVTVPLVQRSYTDLLALQPGVVAQTSGLAGGFAGQFNQAGFAQPPVSGDLTAGNFSVNGARETENAFLLNGATVQEPTFGGAAVIPELDSIAEFRIITNNFNAEYGNYNGGIINVITKSGTNKYHGSLFEFLRNTKLDARNFFDITRGAFNQNQFGGTIGGPIKQDKIFFFADYQGSRKEVAQSSGNITVPSLAEHNGDFSAIASTLTGAVSGPFFAQLLSQRLGFPVTAGEPYFTAGCTTTAQCVFPNAQIPASALDTPSNKLLPFIPVPNNGAFFSSSSEKLGVVDNKASGRGDATTHHGMISLYYLFDDFKTKNPFPTATIPGFSASGKGRTTVANVGYTKTIGSSAVNELRMSFVRLNLILNQPSGGTGPLSSFGFVTGPGTLGIVPGAPQFEGVPEIDFNSFIIGVPSRPLNIVQNTYQVLDNFSKVVSTHTLQVGASFHYTQDTERLTNVANGNFVFTGSETGNDFADFLLGAPTDYVQGQGPPAYGRARYVGAYIQDSWHARSNLTLNYGVRWDAPSPWWEAHNQIQAYVLGEQSLAFPNSPRGFVYPTDPGVSSTLAPTRYNNVAPRIGVAYSPDAENGLLRKLFGGPGKTSLRASFGKFYGSFEASTNFNEIADAPFGNFFVSPVPPLFATPFVDRGTGISEGQRFPITPVPLNVTSQNPNFADFSPFLPISSSPGFNTTNRVPYSEQYLFSIQRQLTNLTLLTLSYVGSQGHRLPATLEINPGNPALCLSVSKSSQVAPGSPTCGPFGENTVFTRADGTVINGTRGPFGPNFGSDGSFSTLGNSNYNSLQVNLSEASTRVQFLLGYTYSKTLDNASGVGEQVNPVNPKLSKELAAFDSTHNFVISYNVNLPIDKLGGPERLTHGWAVSGITRFTTGLPITFVETDDLSLLGTSFTGPIPLPVDTPNFTPGKLNISDPRSGQPFFNTSLFSVDSLGQLGTASRRFLHGPGISNWDVAMLKDTKLTEKESLEFRAEFFNLPNHAQFQTPSGNINSPSFGIVTAANSPRLIQFSLKLLF